MLHMMVEAIFWYGCFSESFSRLEKSVAFDENGVVRPFTIAISQLRGKASPIESWVNMLKDLFEQMERDGTFKDGRLAKVIIL